MGILHIVADLVSTPNVNKLKLISSPGAGTIKTVMTLVFTITGAVAVIFVVIAGIKYSSSQGDPSATAKAKNTIIYAVVGLVVSILAATIVQYAIGHV